MYSSNKLRYYFSFATIALSPRRLVSSPDDFLLIDWISNSQRIKLLSRIQRLALRLSANCSQLSIDVNWAAEKKVQRTVVIRFFVWEGLERTWTARRWLNERLCLSKYYRQGTFNDRGYKYFWINSQDLESDDVVWDCHNVYLEEHWTDCGLVNRKCF